MKTSLLNLDHLTRNILPILIIIMLSSCNDMLEKSPLDRFENDPEFWNNAGNIEGLTNSFYNEFTAYGNNGGYGMFYFKTISDDQIGNPFNEWEYTSIPANSNLWTNGWDDIRMANLIIENVNNSELSDKDKTRFTSIARLMRAWIYYNMVRFYGDLQWVDIPLTIKDTHILYGKRIDRDIIMNYVLDDLNYATEDMPETTSKTSWGRDMANAMKADICLWEGTYRKYRTLTENGVEPDYSGSEKFLSECVKACNYIFSQGYSLNNSYHANYNSTDLSNNPEMIFYKQYRQGVLSHSLISYTCSSTAISGMTKDAFDAYLFLDGKPLALTSLNTDDAGIPLYNDITKQNNIIISKQLAVRDKRLSETIDSVVYFQGSTWARTPDGMQMTSTSGYGCRKYDNTSIPLNYRNQTAANYTCAPVFWLAVVYLNYAEAQAELGQLSQSDLDRSINLLNARAGLPNLNINPGFSDPSNNHGVSDIIWEIRRARRCELMFDNWFRYWDLIRWHQLDKLDTKRYPNLLLGANIKNATEIQVDTLYGYIYAGDKARSFNKRYYLYPIPSGEITLDPQLTQNPFWE